MALTDLVAQVDREMERLRQIRALLTEESPVKRRGARVARAVSTDRPKRILSAEARKKIADAQRARWAKLKSTKKS